MIVARIDVNKTFRDIYTESNWSINRAVIFVLDPYFVNQRTRRRRSDQINPVAKSKFLEITYHLDPTSTVFPPYSRRKRTMRSLAALLLAVHLALASAWRPGYESIPFRFYEELKNGATDDRCGSGADKILLGARNLEKWAVESGLLYEFSVRTSVRVV